MVCTYPYGAYKRVFLRLLRDKTLLVGLFWNYFGGSVKLGHYNLARNIADLVSPLFVISFRLLIEQRVRWRGGQIRWFDLPLRRHFNSNCLISVRIQLSEPCNVLWSLVLLLCGTRILWLTLLHVPIDLVEGVSCVKRQKGQRVDVVLPVEHVPLTESAGIVPHVINVQDCAHNQCDRIYAVYQKHSVWVRH